MIIYDENMCMFTSAFNGFLMYYTQTRIYEVLSPYTTPLPTVLPLAPWLSLCCSNMPSSTSSCKAFALAFSSAWNTLSYIPRVPTAFCLLQKKKCFLRIRYVPGTVRGTRVPQWTKQTSLCYYVVYVLAADICCR